MQRVPRLLVENGTLAWSSYAFKDQAWHALRVQRCRLPLSFPRRHCERRRMAGVRWSFVLLSRLICNGWLRLSVLCRVFQNTQNEKRMGTWADFKSSVQVLHPAARMLAPMQVADISHSRQLTTPLSHRHSRRRHEQAGSRYPCLAAASASRDVAEIVNMDRRLVLALPAAAVFGCGKVAAARPVLDEGLAQKCASLYDNYSNIFYNLRLTLILQKSILTIKNQ